MDNAKGNEQPVATPTGSDYASLTQAERHARAASLFTEEDVAAAEERLKEPGGVTLKQIWKSLWDHQNSRRVVSELE